MPVFYASNTGEAVKDVTKYLLHIAKHKVPQLDVAGVAAEEIGVQIRMEPDTLGLPLVLPVSNKRRFNYRAMVAESLWNLQPSPAIKFLERYVKNMKDFCDGGEYANWHYGNYINADVLDALNKLRIDMNSRQAVVYTSAFGSIKNSPPCLSSVQWLVRDGKLIQIVTMRSNDVYLGLPLDMTQFGIWHQLAAAYLGCPVGEYIHNAGSLHLYTRDVEKAKEFVAGEAGGVQLPELPENGADAIRHALERDVIGWIETFSSSTRSATVTDLVLAQIGSLRPYVEVLAGEYSDPVWRCLKELGYGRGW